MNGLMPDIADDLIVALDLWIRGNADDYCLCKLVFDRYPDLPYKRNMMLYRNEHVVDPTQYSRYTSWTTDRAIAAVYGGPCRKLVCREFTRDEIFIKVDSVFPFYEFSYHVTNGYHLQHEVIVKPIG